MIERYENETRLSLTVNGDKHDTTQISVCSDSSEANPTITLQLRRWSPLFDVTAFLTVTECRELSEACLAAIAHVEKLAIESSTASPVEMEVPVER